MDAVNHDSLDEMVNLAYKLFRARAVVVLTVPLNNNMGPADVGGNWTAMNDRIRFLSASTLEHIVHTAQTRSRWCFMGTLLLSHVTLLSTMLRQWAIQRLKPYEYKLKGQKEEKGSGRLCYRMW